MDYLHTDWEAMTRNDWIGTILTVVVFLLMVGLYVIVLRPKNRDAFEAQKHIPIDDDEMVREDDARISTGEKNGG